MDKDPTPGDPDRVRNLAKNLHDFADDVSKVLRDIKGMAGEDAILTWAGKTAESFTAEFEDAPGKLKKLKKSYEMAGDALSAYWPELERSQALADKALAKGREAQSSLSAAQSRLTSADSWVDKAGKEADKYKDDDGSKAGKDVPKPDPDKVKAATRNANSAEKAQTAAKSDVSAAKSNLDAAKKMAEDARKMRENAAGTAKKKLEEASDAGIQNRKWWEEVGDWVTDNWDTIVAVCKVVVAVLGVIAMIIGGPILGAIVLIAALVVLADTLHKYANGEAGLLDVAFAALDCIPGMKGLTSLRGLAKGMKGLKAGLRGGGLKALRSGADNLVAKAKSFKGRCKNGDPIDMISGEMLMQQTDLELPGTLPLVLRRTHLSTYRWGRFFGASWASTLDQRLEIDAHGVMFATEDGMLIAYPVPEPGLPVFPIEGPRWPLEWDGSAHGSMTVTDPATGHTRHFSALPGNSDTGETHITLALREIVDRNGHRITIDYGIDGIPSMVSHSGGYRVALDADEGHLTRIRLVDHIGHGEEVELLRYAYDADDNLAQIFNSSTLPFQLTYDEESRITSWNDRNGSGYQFTYDDDHRVIRGEGSDSFLSCTVAYDNAHRTTRYTDSIGHTTTYEYNDLMQLVAETDPLGNVIRTEWDRHGRQLARIDQTGGEVRLRYDTFGNVRSIERQDGSRFLAEYNSLGLPTRAVETDGTVWHHEYDDRGNRIRSVDPTGAETSYSFDDAGNLTAVTDALGRVRQVVTDGAGLAVITVDPFGHETRIGRDSFGRVTSVTDPLGRVVRMTWTPEGRMSKREFPDGSVESWTWDGEENLTSHTNRSGSTTTYTYTHFELPSSRTDPGGATHTFEYDSELRLTKVTNAEQFHWTYDYDPTGHLIAETDFNGRRLTYQHDPAGRLVSRTNGMGESISFVRDPVGRIVEQNSGDGRTTLTYDLGGSLVRAANADAEVTWTHDELGRILTEKVNSLTTSYSYDAVGNRIHRETPSGAAANWTYDAVNRPTVLNSTGHELSFAYDEAGFEIERCLDRSATLVQGWDSSGRLARQALTTHEGELVQRRDYSYNAEGYLTEARDRFSGHRSMELDPVGRVTAVHARDWTESYAYDVSGNLVRSSGPGADAQAVREYSGTLVRRVGRSSYQHDAQGRLVRQTKRLLNGQRHTWTYTWNRDDRLVEVSQPDGARWRYTYDPLGRRLEKQQLTHDGALVGAVRFSWDGTVLAEQTTDCGHTTTWDYDPDSYRPLAQSAHDRSKSTSQREDDRRFFAIVTDMVGTPTELVDEGGQVAWTARTGLWGQDFNHPQGDVSTPLRFPGQYHDEETGFHYNYNRYYDPLSARYCSNDPLGLKAGPTPQSYVRNPTGRLDALGLTESGDLEWVHPDDVNFSQRTVSSNNYADAMRAGEWDWERPGTALRVIEVDGQLVTYDNRRLDAAREVGDNVAIQRVDPNAPHPDSTTGKTWGDKFRQRFNDPRNRRAGGVVPETGLQDRPSRVCRG
ncbi:DUF6531 domain-containing protein [Streptomyces longisporoflavus]|uniref:DUF6531 domain-containing protein n=1 Tax=Streptomyces longisporoflavus TaxID=28044 RepID=A0ABW7QTB1_9ACTN